MTQQQAPEQVDAVFELANALDSAGRLVSELDDCRSTIEELVSKLSAMIGEAQGHWDALKSLCGGRPTNRDELLAWLKTHPWVKHKRFKGTPSEEVLKFDRYADRRLYFGDQPSAFHPLQEQKSFGVQSIHFGFEGFVLEHYGDQFFFTYLMNTVPHADQAS